MFIFGCMTAVAGIRNTHELMVDMAGRTFRIKMGTFKHEARERVIDAGVTPARRVMAGLTLIAQPAFMHIICPMTSRTILRGRLQDRQRERIPMTASAIHAKVLSLEWVIRALVVKTT
jgi:hypothetical protein